MACNQSAFIWYELMTGDPDAAGKFYNAVVGWTFGDKAPPEMSGGIDYRQIGRSDGGAAGGVLGLSQEMIAGGAHPAWLGYLQSDDVDATVAAIVADGGKVQMQAFDMPVGRIAMVTDPQGAPIYVMKPIPPADRPDAKSDVFDTEQPQHVRWNELMSSDPERLGRFLRQALRHRPGRFDADGRTGRLSLHPKQRRGNWRDHGADARNAHVSLVLLHRRRRHRSCRHGGSRKRRSNRY